MIPERETAPGFFLFFARHVLKLYLLEMIANLDII